MYVCIYMYVCMYVYIYIYICMYICYSVILQALAITTTSVNPFCFLLLLYIVCKVSTVTACLSLYVSR